MDATIAVVILVVLVPLIVVVGLVAVVWVFTRPSGVDPGAYPGLIRLRRLTTLTRFAGLGVALVVCGVLGGAGYLGQGLLLIPAVFALVQIAATIAGELATRGAARSGGGAALETRWVRDYLPRPLTWEVTGGAVALAILLTWTTAIASSDDMGRAGRTLEYVCARGCDTGAMSPWPGSFYSLPVAVVLAAMVALAVIAVPMAVRRPRNGADPQVLQIDEQVRHRSVRGTVGAVGVAIGGTLAIAGLAVAMRLAQGAASMLPLDLQAAGWVSLVLAIAGLVLAVRSLMALLSRGAGVPAISVAR